MGLLSTIGGILGLIVCCAVSISWRIRHSNLFHYIISRMRLFDSNRSAQFSNDKEPSSPSEKVKLGIWLMPPHKNSILEKILENAHHLALSQRYPLVSTFSYRLGLLLASLYRRPTSSLSRIQIWAQIIWNSHGRGILTGLNTWRGVQSTMNPSLDWASETEHGHVEHAICSQPERGKYAFLKKVQLVCTSPRIIRKKTIEK